MLDHLRGDAAVRHRVHGPHAAFEATRHFNQQQVPHPMPMPVVEGFEIVKSEEQQRAV